MSIQTACEEQRLLVPSAEAQQAAYIDGLIDARQAAEAQAAEELRAAWLDGFRLGLREAYGPAFHDGYRAARAAGVSNGNVQAPSH